MTQYNETLCKICSLIDFINTTREMEDLIYIKRFEFQIFKIICIRKISHVLIKELSPQGISIWKMSVIFESVCNFE